MPTKNDIRNNNLNKVISYVNRNRDKKMKLIILGNYDTGKTFILGKIASLPNVNAVYITPKKRITDDVFKDNVGKSILIYYDNDPELNDIIASKKYDWFLIDEAAIINENLLFKIADSKANIVMASILYDDNRIFENHDNGIWKKIYLDDIQEHKIYHLGKPTSLFSLIVKGQFAQ